MPNLLPRPMAIAMLMLVACMFAANHVAARFAFDDGAGLLLAILCRSGATLLILAGLLLWQRPEVRLRANLRGWQLLLGLLIAVQSLCLYSAVARIPVALALLISNTFPIMLALLTWALGGSRPTRRASAIMGVILIGLVLVLDLPSRLTSMDSSDPLWWAGVTYAVLAALAFASALWVTDHKLKALPGAVRTFFTMLIVFSSMAIAGAAGAVPGGMSWPSSSTGWLGLGALMVLYGSAFVVLFVSLPRLNMAENAPVMNIEPVASLLLGWSLLGQTLAPIQMVGGAVVLSGIAWLAKGH